MGILGITALTQCQHCKIRYVQWVDNVGVSEAPRLFFSGMPENGSMILSKNEIIVLCSRCASPKSIADDVDIQGMRIASAVRGKKDVH